MSFGTDFKANIFLSGMDIKNEQQVLDHLEDLHFKFEELSAKLKMFVSSNPRDIVPEEWKEEPIRWLNDQVNELVDEIRDNTILKVELNLYLNKEG